MLMKVKLITEKDSDEVVVGEGVAHFDQQKIDSSIRVPIYDKRQGIEEVAICSVDFFISGNKLDKNVSILVDKSGSRGEDWRDRTEDVVFSQMSYTV